MKFKTKILRKLETVTGYEIFKKQHAPVGYDLHIDLLHKLLLPMTTVFDVGANTGQTVEEISSTFPNAQIFSFEPVSATFQQLQKNTAGMSQVHCSHAALGDVAGKVDIRLYPDDESVTNSLNPATMNQATDAQVESITVVTGDEFCVQNGIKEIDLLKIDTEGYELNVIKGFSEMLNQQAIQAIYCEVTFNPYDATHTYINDLNSLVFSFGYVFYSIYNISNSAIKVGRNYANVLYVNPATKARLIN